MAPYNKVRVFLKAFFKNDFPLGFMESKTVKRIESKLAEQEKQAQPPQPGATTEKKPTPPKKSAKGIRGVLRRSKKEAVSDKIIKAFERRDDFTLVDPREFYGALESVSKRVLEWLSSSVEGMKESESKTVPLPVKGAELKIRKLAGDMYSGWLLDKKGDIEHLYDRLTLPALASQIMAVYEVYRPEKEEKFESPRTLHSLREEIESINEELKGLKGKKDKELVGLRLKGLIDNLASLQEMIEDHKKDQNDKHDAHKQEFSNIHQKLEELKAKLPAPPQPAVDEPQMEDKVPVKQVGEPSRCDDCGANPCKCYIHLPRPTIQVEPNGKVVIFFKSEWSDIDKLNFMKSMRYVIDKKRK